MLRTTGQRFLSAVRTSLQISARHESTEYAEKSVNQVTLLGRVGLDPAMKGTQTNPVLVFKLATNHHFRSQDEIRQKTEWHRVAIFKPHLRETAATYLRKGHRVLVQGKLCYGEITDAKGIEHTTSTVIADELIFLGAPAIKSEEEQYEAHA